MSNYLRVSIIYAILIEMNQIEKWEWHQDEKYYSPCIQQYKGGVKKPTQQLHMVCTDM